MYFGISYTVRVHANRNEVVQYFCSICQESNSKLYFIYTVEPAVTDTVSSFDKLQLPMARFGCFQL